MAVTLRNRRWFRLLSHACRTILALTFVLSGFVKSIDPWGTALNVGNYLAAYGLESLGDYVMAFSIWLCGAELMMGLMLLFKVRIRLISIFAICSMTFFTVLTLVSATLIPIEDCGCFGDFLKLTPWETFTKNAILWPMTVIVWWRYRPDRILKMSRLEMLLTVLFCSCSMGLGVYCYRHLPLLDFLPYRKGVNIAAAMEEARTRTAEEKVVLVYRNRQNGRLREFSLDDTAWHNEEKWEWVETRVEDNPDHIEPTILEFNILSLEGEVTDALLSVKGALYLLCTDTLPVEDKECEMHLCAAVEQARNEGAAVVCLTSDSLPESGRTLLGGSCDVECYNVDAKTLKTILRAEAGLVILRDGVISEKLNWRDIE